ncbi:MAG: DUF6183 family protein [Actinomycetota bacterium]|nr:DUF6183 family protein [Actinomycetota bacterium]
MNEQLLDLIEAGDLNGLLRSVDGLAGRRAWDEMLELADRCDDAIERGKQLWPIIGHIDYRIALEAPGEYAAGVLESELSRFLLGPLTEVAASTHTWSELAPHLTSAQAAAYVAQERVLRGEVLTGDDATHPEILDLPLELMAWEPTYALAAYRADHVEVAEPWEPRTPLAEVKPQPAAEVPDEEVVNVLLDLVTPWTNESNGAARAVVVEGDALGAASRLAFSSMRMAPLERAEALQQIAWAAASGGAHGRRRGAAFGRFSAWYTSAVLCGYEWPVATKELRDAGSRLNWYRWDEGAAEEGWVLRLAVEDPVDGWAAAVAATDVLAEV